MALYLFDFQFRDTCKTVKLSIPTLTFIQCVRGVMGDNRPASYESILIVMQKQLLKGDPLKLIIFIVMNNLNFFCQTRPYHVF